MERTLPFRLCSALGEFRLGLYLVEELAMNNKKKLTLILLALSSAGCMTRIENRGSGYTVRVDSGTKANASLSLSAYARGAVLETEASEAGKKEDGQTWIDTQGGGEVRANANTKVGAGNDTQDLTAVTPSEDVESVPEE